MVKHRDRIDYWTHMEMDNKKIITFKKTTKPQTKHLYSSNEPTHKISGIKEHTLPKKKVSALKTKQLPRSKLNRWGRGFKEWLGKV